MKIVDKTKHIFNQHPLIYKLLNFLLSIIRVALVIAFVILAYQISDWIASWCMKNFFGVPYTSLDRDRTVIYGSIKCFLPSLVFILISMLLARSWKGLENMGLLIRFKWWHIIGLLLCVPLFLAISYFAVWLQKELWFHNPWEYLYWHIGWGWHHMSQHGTGWNGYDFGFLYYSVICAPISEEVLFRGWLYGRLRKIVPGKWFVPIAILITSICFAWIHHEFKLAFSAFLFSVCLCILREYTKNIYGGILIHALWNFQTFL